MKKIDEIDKNFKIETDLNEKNIRFYNVKEKPFDLYGFYNSETGRQFTRMPPEIAKNISEGVYTLCHRTAGGRVRFGTNSPYIAISVQLPSICPMPHMPLSGSAGFDLYTFSDNVYRYEHSFIPSNEAVDGYEAIYYFEDAAMRDITINFPLYNDVSELYIGVSENSVISEGEKYINEKPVVYYGSSITQGGCASRPGNSYQGMLSRRFNIDFVNLGFSGCAKGERLMADYISGMDMSCFVFDYDHNAQSVEFLEKTHASMFDIIREKNPDLPIIMLSRPDIRKSDETDERFGVIEKTYNAAKQRGDKNVYLIDGRNIMRNLAGDSGTVDGCHPNDLGFFCMAESIGAVLEKILK